MMMHIIFNVIACQCALKDDGLRDALLVGVVPHTWEFDMVHSYEALERY